jgi:competence protein ComEA
MVAHHSGGVKLNSTLGPQWEFAADTGVGLGLAGSFAVSLRIGFGRGGQWHMRSVSSVAPAGYAARIPLGVASGPILVQAVPMTHGARKVIRCLSAIPCLLGFAALTSSADDLQSFFSARLAQNQPHDGDSFYVDVGDQQILVRLYFVDCPEISTGTTSDAERVQEQARYFGLSDATRVIHFGKEAGKFVAEALAKPFTLHTAFATAPGRSTQRRVYGFITTADGNDLSTLLVQHGYARTYGTGRATPQGVSREEMFGRLRDLEVAAVLKRAGIWAESDSERIAELRASQRHENQELKQLQERVAAAQTPAGPIDLNTATREQLQSVKGIGPVLAGRIIATRPFKSIEDLKKVAGIGRKRFEQLRPHFVVREENNPTTGGQMQQDVPK